jgi:hydroxypyruvate reductase
MHDPRRLLQGMFQPAIAAAQPAACLPQQLPSPPRGRTMAVGAGKAPAAMAQAIEWCWPGGETREVGIAMAGIARTVARRGEPLAGLASCCRAARRPYRCAAAGRAAATSSSVLPLAAAVNGEPSGQLLAGDTDGVDGVESVAGAYVAPDTLAGTRALGFAARLRRAPQSRRPGRA